MNTDKARQRLLVREQELVAEISRLEEEVRNSRTAEVEDTADQAISSENKAAAFQEQTIAVETLNQVRGALDRVRDGTYGVCTDCGRPIEARRLEAVPWALYCLADQEKHDEESAAAEA